MNFWRRFKLYGFGFGMGLLLVYAMFGTRSCTTPNEVRMEQLVFQTFELSDKAKCKLRCLKKNEQLLKLELHQFEINYNISSVHNEPCGQYYTQPKEKYKNDYNYTLVMNDCDTITKIFDINISGKNDCNCQ